MSDSSRNIISKSKNKVRNYTKELIRNYLNEKNKKKKVAHFEKLTKHLREKNNFNVNQNLGFEIELPDDSLSNYLVDIVLATDDVALFSFLRELGLSDITHQDNKLWYSLMYFNCAACFDIYYSERAIQNDFSIDEINPLGMAIALHNHFALKVILNHPEFKTSYLYAVDKTKNRNALELAATYFNTNAIKALLKLKAPCFTSNNILTAHDHAFKMYLDYFSKNKVSNHFRKKTGLEPLTASLNANDVFIKAMNFDTILETFYLLLNHTPQIRYCFTLYHNEKIPNIKSIFEYIFEIQQAQIPVSPVAFKTFLDIILSIGPGLNFNALPVSMKALYVNDVSKDAEVCFPIMHPGKKTIYLDSAEKVESYLSENIKEHKAVGALFQYIENIQSNLNLDEKSVKITNKIKEIISRNFDCMDIINNVIWPDQTLTENNENKNDSEKLKSIHKNILVTINKENTSTLVSTELFSLEKLEELLPSNEFYLKFENHPQFIVNGINQNAKHFPSLLINLLRLNETYNQLNKVEVYQTDHELIFKSIALFKKMCAKIDFYAMIYLHHEFNLEKKSAIQSIESLTELLNIIKILNKKNSLKDQKEYLPAMLRTQYFIYGLLVQAYINAKQPKSAKAAFKQAMLLIKGAKNPDLFKNAYQTMIHHAFAIKTFTLVIEYGFDMLSVEAMYKHLSQVIRYEEGMIFQQSFSKNLAKYLTEAMKNNRFSHIDKILTLLKIYAPKDNRISVVELTQLKESKIQEYINDIEKMIFSLGLDEKIKLDINNYTLHVDLSDVHVTLNQLKKYFPAESNCMSKILQFSDLYLNTIDEMNEIFLTINLILENDLKYKKKQIDRINGKIKNSNSVLEDNFDLEKNMSYLSLYDHTKVKRLPRKNKIQDSTLECKKGDNFIFNIKEPEIKINRAELKKLAKIGDEFSDLIMITDSFSGNSKRYLAIINESEFDCFKNACHHFENNEGEWAVKSVNPYGQNQHGVKLYENKQNQGHQNNNHSAKTTTTTTTINTNHNSNLKSEKYLIKIKGSGSERAIGVGKEVDYQGKKIIIYQVDTILTHKKADKVLKF